jgi:hypothetical protein
MLRERARQQMREKQVMKAWRSRLRQVTNPLLRVAASIGIDVLSFVKFAPGGT